MTESAGAGGAADDATVETDPYTADAEAAAQQAREDLADQTEAEVAAIEAKLEGMKEALKAKKAEAKALRREANQGGED